MASGNDSPHASYLAALTVICTRSGSNNSKRLGGLIGALRIVSSCSHGATSNDYWSFVCVSSVVIDSFFAFMVGLSLGEHMNEVDLVLPLNSLAVVAENEGAFKVVLAV